MSIFRRFVLLALAVSLWGCAFVYPVEKMPLVEDAVTVGSIQDTFLDAVEQLRLTGRSATLEAFAATYPEADLSRVALVLIELTREVRWYREQRDHLQANLQEQIENNRLLEEKSLRLSDTIDQLKGLLIQLEQRAGQDQRFVPDMPRESQ